MFVVGGRFRIDVLEMPPQRQRRSELCAAVVLLLICIVTGAKEKERYSNSWAVEVRGGAEKAEELARKHGFVNLGQVRIQLLTYINDINCMIDHVALYANVMLL